MNLSSHAFRILLIVLGALLTLASRVSANFRRAITRDLVFEIASADGVAHHFVFCDRRVSSHTGTTPTADCRLRFAGGAQGLRTLVSRRAITHLLNGLSDGTVTLQGNPFHLLWFYDLTQRVAPLAERVTWETPPSAYLAPNTTAVWAQRVVREPVATALDPTWEAATRQGAKLTMVRVAAGEATKEF